MISRWLAILAYEFHQGEREDGFQSPGRWVCTRNGRRDFLVSRTCPPLFLRSYARICSLHHSQCFSSNLSARCADEAERDRPLFFGRLQGRFRKRCKRRWISERGKDRRRLARARGCLPARRENRKHLLQR